MCVIWKVLMTFDRELLFLLSSIGVFNASILSIYFLFILKPISQSSRFLGLLLLVLSIRIWKSVFFYFDPDISKIYLQIGLSACFLIGPYLMLYTLSRFQYIKTWIWLVILIPLYSLIIGVGNQYPYNDYSLIWGNLIYSIIMYSWLFFNGVSLYVMFKNVSFKEKMDFDSFWTVNVVIGVFIIWLAYYFIASFTSYIIGAVLFSFVFYLSILLIYRNRSNFFRFKRSTPITQRFKTNEIDRIDAELSHILYNEKPFIDPNLQLSDLARLINMSPHRLSEFINSKYKQSFTHFINHYRIQESLRIFNAEPNISIESASEKSGFNSTSTFYSAFKKETQMTPAKYLSNNS
jgi:AraC-like DNA-binding protein